MNSPSDIGQHELTLDREYGQCLQVLRDLIPGLEEPIDITTTAQWIERFNRTQRNEKALRNRCVKLLMQQLLEDNLTHPFIFPHFLNEPLEVLLQNDPEIMGDGPLEPLQQLVTKVETLNKRTDDDLLFLRGGAVEDATTANGEPNYRDVDYLVHFQKALQSALLLNVPEIIENPEANVGMPRYNLRTDDSQWLTVVLEGIRAKAASGQRHAIEMQHRPTTSTECQTVETSLETSPPLVSIDRTESERYLERKFAKLYANFRVREKALEIKAQSAGGMHLIDVSQRLGQLYRRSYPPSQPTFVQKSTVEWHNRQRRLDN